jgi:hypothetical protein
MHRPAKLIAPFLVFIHHAISPLKNISFVDKFSLPLIGCISNADSFLSEEGFVDIPYAPAAKGPEAERAF